MLTSLMERIQLTMLRDSEGFTDGALLGNFIEHHDQIALAALIHRHGPMVWGVCRRLLSHHDTEDAFQATFLVLVRKATSVVPRELVGNWLYGVAYQTALQARRTVTRRKVREVQVKEMPDREDMRQTPWSDLRSVLDEELNCLPDIYRAVIVLCDLEDRTRKEVARQLGVPEGTVGGRLARARALLAKRLSRRGIVLPSGSLIAVLTAETTSASVLSSLVASTIEVASLLAAGRAAGVLSVKVAALTKGVVKAMFVTKIKSVLAVSLAAVCIGGMALFLSSAMGQPLPAEKNAGNAKPAAVERRPVEIDRDKLQGRWEIVSIAVEGKIFKTEDKPDELKGIDLNDVLIKGDRLQPTKADKLNSCWHGKFKLDDTCDPKRITIHDEGPDGKLTFRGIYSLEGDAFRVCINGDGTDVCRPEEFVTKKGSPVFIVTFKKVATKK